MDRRTDRQTDALHRAMTPHMRQPCVQRGAISLQRLSLFVGCDEEL